MIILVAHAVLGVVTIWQLTRCNPAIFRRTTPRLSPIEAALYVVGVASIVGGYAFNIAFVNKYSHLGGIHNPLWGHGSWAQYIHLMYANPAAGSAGIDYTIANVVLLPVITIVDGRRRGIVRPWLFFASTLFTSFTFGWAFYAATVERQQRVLPKPAPLPTTIEQITA
jgi:drug/metabolite transporter (DMT)-like permease